MLQTPTDRTDLPRIRDSVLVYRDGNRMQFFCLSDLRVIEFTVPEFVPELVRLMDGQRGTAELSGMLPGEVSVEEVRGVISTLAEEQLLERSVDLVQDGTGRYSRQLRFFEEMVAGDPSLPPSAEALQDRLRQARVVLVGAGGIGSWVIGSLVAAGVGRLDVVDPDLVERSNLNRQLLYLESDVGMPKAEAAVRHAWQANAAVRIRSLRRWVHTENDLEDLVPGADLIVCCADDPSVVALSDLISTVAQRHGVPHIVGGAYGGNLGIPGVSVLPGRTVCWDCIRQATARDHGRRDMEILKERERPAGSTAAIAGITANLTAWDAVRILIGVAPALAGHVREMDIMSLDWRTRHVKPRPECPNCPAREVGVP